MHGNWWAHNQPPTTNKHNNIITKTINNYL